MTDPTTPDLEDLDVEPEHPMLGKVCSDLRHLTRRLAASGVEPAGGVLGGRWGYGAEYVGTCFQMHPFWWGECTCGFDERETTWWDARAHAGDCYQSELVRRGYPDADLDPASIARSWGLPEIGCAVHCTCGLQGQWEAYLAVHGHDPACPIVRPNFTHPGTGVQVRWYKYIGRGMELAGVTTDTWQVAFSEALAEVAALRGTRRMG